MAVKITSKTKPKAASKVTESMQSALMKDMQEIVDSAHPDVLAMKKAEAELKKHKAKVETYRKDLLELTEAYLQEEDEAVNVIGEVGTASVSKCSQSRKVTDKEKLIEVLDGIKDGLAFELAEFKLGDVDKYLTPDQTETVVSKVSSKSRTVKWG